MQKALGQTRERTGATASIAVATTCFAVAARSKVGSSPSGAESTNRPIDGG